MSTKTTDPASDDALMTRVMWRIMPLTIACLVISTIDRSNIGFAKLGMLSDLSFSERAFGFGSSLFYLGYVLLEMPSTLASYKYGAKLWFARIMVTWTATTLLLAFIKSTYLFYLLRFALGAAEAGLFPAIIFYMTLWFPAQQRARAMGLATLGSAFGNGIGALVCGLLLDLNGRLGLAGWQWIFVVTGLMPLITTVLVLRYLPNSPKEATFLSESERERVAALLAKDPSPASHGHVLSVLLDPKVIGFGVIYAALLGSLYGVIYWMPTVLRDFGISGSLNGLVLGMPWAFDALLLVLIMPRLRSGKAVELGLLALCVLAVASFAAAASGGGLAFKGSAMMIGIPAISLCMACFWTIPVRYFSGEHSAAAIGGISTIGNLGGVVTLNMMPALAQHLGSPARALWAPSIGMGILGLWALVMVVRAGAAKPAAV